MLSLDTGVCALPGIGERRGALLGKLGVNTLLDMLLYFPRAYEDRRSFRQIGELVPGENACVRGMVAAPPTYRMVRRGVELVKLRAVDSTGQLDITFFNQRYMKTALQQGRTYIFYGKAEGAGTYRSMVNPLVEPETGGALTGRIVPIYHLTAGITQAVLSKAMYAALEVSGQVPDCLPEELRRRLGLWDAGPALRQIHFPDSEEGLAAARRRLVFEELFLLSIALRGLREQRESHHIQPMPPVDLSPFLEALPFDLTGAQRRAIRDILADLAGDRPMNRLCQGDVGSGKTMVAAAAIYAAARNGRQSALMAPTEMLASQHHRTLAPLLEGLGLRCALLTGSTPAAARRKVLSQLAGGELDLVTGTHALISGDVAYRDLGLVVTDEQHRFGVAQRAALAEKGQQAHVLVMSATPIPRTLALLLYGDLDVSVIDELPPGRRKVDTFAVDSRYHQRIYAFLRKHITAGRQAYIICPMVETAEGVPDDRKAVTEYAAYLQDQVFPDLRVAAVHGKMRDKEKVMAVFAAGEGDILVSTTVVEVGVDVPNAAVIVIENAERFGLSQLHQLRGRVGRGSWQSYCILVSDDRDPETRARLKVMTQTNDGFKIAEEDLRLRGPGDLLGQRQHGLPALKIADLSCDVQLLTTAQQEAEALLRADPALERYPLIAQRVQALLDRQAGAMN